MMMTRAAVAAFVVSLSLLAASACGAKVNLATSLEVTDVLTGFYDAGLKDGWNYLKPSITFRLKNKGQEDIGPVQLTVAFWKGKDDGEWDSHIMRAIRDGALAPGASTEPLVARSPNVGFRLEGARAEFFNHSSFQDVEARLFAQQAGNIYPLGKYKIDRVIIPHMGN
jgi:hypothetical protein